MRTKSPLSRAMTLIGVILLVLGNGMLIPAQAVFNEDATLTRSGTSRAKPANRTVDPARIEYLKSLKGTFRTDLRPPSKDTKKVTLLVEFQGEPAVVAHSNKVKAGASRELAKSAATDAIRINLAQQLGARRQLTGLGAVELYSVQRVLNASVVRAEFSKMEQIAKIPGVKRVSLAPIHYLHNSTSVPFVGANNVWDTTGILGSLGLTGEDVTIAIIDTGIDYLHYNFGGDADYANQTDVTSLSDHDFSPSRVVDGWDFVGENYNANSDSPALYTPFPDADPTDCNGHGSHVAGSAAGNGVLGGSPYSGPYDNLTPAALAGFDIGPGTAPEADIVALKVFGCDGSTSVVIQAIEHATDPNNDGDFSDHYDVINMSLGSSYGGSSEYEAIANATAAGVIVVTSAGNAGDTHYITSSPGSAREAISVAAVSDSGIVAASVDDVGNATSYYAIPASFGQALTSLTPAVAASYEQPPGNDNGCAAGDFAGFTAGRIALIDRGGCDFDVKVKNAQDAGASAAVVVNVSTNVPFVMGGDDLTVTIPSVMISNDAGALLKADLPTTGQLNPAGPPQSDMIAEFSSRGPRRSKIGGLLLKPDISAPGVSIDSTSTGYDGSAGYPTSGADVLTISGTSMASPHVAGTMALLRQQHPTWTVAQLKALVMNTANHGVFSPDLITGLAGDEHGTSRAGAGRLDAVLATSDSVFAYDTADPGAVSLTFTNSDGLNGTVWTETRTVTIENKNTGSVTFNVAYNSVKDADGVDISVSPATVSIPKNKKKTVTVTATYTAADMLHILDPVSSDMQSTYRRHWVTEETGYVYMDAVSGTGTDLRVPLYSAPRPTSEMSSPSTLYMGGDSGNVDVPLTGVDVLTTTGGTTPGGSSQNYVSRVSAFNLAYSSPRMSPDPTEYDGSDIQYVGVMNDYYWGGVTSLFGLSMWRDWDTPTARDVYMCLDLDQDGSGGAFGDGTDFCFVTHTVFSAGGDGQDVFMTGIWDINGFFDAGEGFFLGEWDYQNGRTAANDTRIFNNSVLLLNAETSPAFWSAFMGAFDYTTDPGTTDDTDEAFNYYIYTIDANDPDGDITDVIPQLTYDPVTPVLDHLEGTSGAFGAILPMVSDLNGTNFSFEFDISGQADDDAELLMLHHYNNSGSRAQVVTISELSAPLYDCGLIINCDMELDSDTNNIPDNWTEKNTIAGDMLSAGTGLNGNSYVFSGGLDGWRKLRQDINVSGSAGDQFQLTGRVDRTAAPANAKVEIKLFLFNTDGTKQKVTISVPDGTDFSTLLDSGVFTATKNYDKIRVDLRVNMSSGTVHYDEITLVPVP